MFTNSYAKLRMAFTTVCLVIFNVYLMGQYPPNSLNPCNDHDPCTVDIVDHCGNCFHIRKNCNEMVCDDGDPCTYDIIDMNGNCLHFPKVCDDGNPATHDYCDQWGECRHEPIDCDDHDPDTYDYVDAYGHCQHVREVCCDDNNPCTEDYIDPHTGECVHEFICDDGDPCTIDVCNPNTGECWNTPKNCDDGNPCTIDYCDPYTGECVHEPRNCDDGDPCTMDACDPYTGECRHRPDPSCTPCPEAYCDDDNPCTYDFCDPHTGQCVHVAIDCDDGDPCTIDSCNPYTGECIHEIDPWCNDPCGTVNCDDGNPCTIDYCNPNTGQCINFIIYCDDGDPCTIDTCDPYTGQCVFTPDPSCGNTPACGFVQEFWGNPNSMFGGQTTAEILDDILFNNPLVVGVVGQRSLTVNNPNRFCLFDLLPGSGTAGPLPNNTGDVSVTMPNCSAAPIPTTNNGALTNPLLTQTMALSLNIKFDPAQMYDDILLQQSCVDVPSAILNMLPANPDVGDLLDLANNALAGLVTPNYNLLTTAITEITETYDNCNLPCIHNFGGNSSGLNAPQENDIDIPGGIAVQPTNGRQHAFKLFPNPSSQTLMVDLRDYAGKKANILVMNTLGQPVHVANLTRLPENIIPINVANFIDGIYFMKVKIDDQEELTREFVVSHK